MAELTTTPNGIWMLQALLGVEKMPTALRLRPFVPSVDGDGTVATELGDVPWSQTAEYASLAAAGVIDDRGQRRRRGAGLDGRRRPAAAGGHGRHPSAQTDRRPRARPARTRQRSSRSA